MQDLQVRVQKMIEGETKRREVALQWIEEVKDILVPVASHLWGAGTRNTFGEGVNAIPITKPNVHTGGDDPTFNGLYFRYEEHRGTTETETPGFYFSENQEEDFYWGTPLEDFKGANFWGIVRTIMEWIPNVMQLMDQKEISREKLVSKLVVK